MKNVNETNIHIRIAEPEDAEVLLAVYAPYVEETAITFEYSVPSVGEFQERIRNTLQQYPYLVAEDENGILGYAYAGRFQSRAAYDWAVETSIYIRKDQKGRGLGRRLYHALEEGLKEQGLTDFALKACSCDGIEACKIALLKKSKNLLDANFIEGMACVGGCIGGAGCLTHGEKNKAEVDKYGMQAYEKTISDAVSMLKNI